MWARDWIEIDVVGRLWAAGSGDGNRMSTLPMAHKMGGESGLRRLCFFGWADGIITGTRFAAEPNNGRTWNAHRAKLPQFHLNSEPNKFRT